MAQVRQLQQRAPVAGLKEWRPVRLQAAVEREPKRLEMRRALAQLPMPVQLALSWPAPRRRRLWPPVQLALWRRAQNLVLVREQAMLLLRAAEMALRPANQKGLLQQVLVPAPTAQPALLVQELPLFQV